MATESTLPRRYRLVIALDRSEYSEIVLEHALDQAVRHDAVELHFVTVERDDELLADAADWLAQTAAEGLDTFSHEAHDWTKRLHVRIGDAAEEIASFGAEIQADLLVIGRSGVQEAHGSIADGVIARAECPVLVVNLAGHQPPSEIQCPTCVEVRAGSEGERWFCDEHSGDAPQLTTSLPSSAVHGSRTW
jgi:nucleotide-binding universal stress UspA family protein